MTMRDERRVRPGPRSARRFGLLALALALEMNAAPAPAQALHPERRRITDEAIAADEAAMEKFASHLAALSPGESPDRVYRLAAAKAWLALARDQYRLNDRSGLVDDAFARAAAFGTSLEGRVASPPSGPVRGTTPVRPELWALADSLKKGEGFRCAAEAIAALEVQLVRAGHEDLRCRPTEPHPELAATARLAAEARRLAAGCVPPKPVAEAAPATPIRGKRRDVKPTAHLEEARVAPVRAALGKLSVLNVIHFELNSSAISPRSRAILDTIAATLTATPEVTARLWGHTDPRGSAAYNQALGRRRASTVRDYLVAAGVEPRRLTVTSAGKSRLRAAGTATRDHAINRRVELVYTGPEGLRLQSQDQERDLQLERKPTKSKSPTRTTGTTRRQTPKR
jgi:outer membrane protein OmpA-like peptidoglycan-associated protein